MSQVKVVHTSSS